jgi:hypothetical protein
MRSSPLQELNLNGCRFLIQLPLHTVPVPPIGTSCMSIISQIATNPNHDQSPRSNLTQMFGAFRLKFPTGNSNQPSPNDPLFNSKYKLSINTVKKEKKNYFKISIFISIRCPEDCEEIQSKEDMEFYSDNLNVKSQWPHLTKLSLTETVASFQVKKNHPHNYC